MHSATRAPLRTGLGEPTALSQTPWLDFWEGKKRGKMRKGKVGRRGRDGRERSKGRGGKWKGTKKMKWGGRQWKKGRENGEKGKGGFCAVVIFH